MVADYMNDGLIDLAAEIAGTANLLESIRALPDDRGPRIVILSGAVTERAADLVASGLVTHAERSGMRALRASLVGTVEGSSVVAYSDTGVLAGEGALSVHLEKPSSAELHRWIAETAPAAELVVIAGPPLAVSIDAALLACACDGLVIVAESEVTDRAALRTAAERARIAGCRTLGIVMHGPKDRVPNWIHRFMGTRTASGQTVARGRVRGIREPVSPA